MTEEIKMSDFNPQPTVIGRIKAAWIANEEHPDVLHVEILERQESLGNLLQTGDDEDNPDPNRPICLFGREGTLRDAHGFSDEKDLIGKLCIIYSGGRYDIVVIEKPNNNNEPWPLVIWTEYV